jgi:peptidoglycan/LPS O-acetylase OafA/YrhL
MNQRVEGLEGMRGIAAFWVYTHHFLLIFYPTFYFGEHTWINSILNPDLAVSWFFVHSGFVLAYKGNFLKGFDYQLSLLDHVSRRYLRLIPPVILSILFTYVLMKAGLQFNREYGQIVNSSWLANYLNFEPNLADAIGQSFYGTYFYFKSSTTYNPCLWTIGYELIGSYLLFVMLSITGFKRKLLWMLLPLAFWIGPWKGMMTFILGALLSRIPAHKAHWIIILICTVVGFALSDLVGPYKSYYRAIGATLLMYALLQAPALRSILANRFFTFLGNISYSLYVLHFALLMSVTSYLGMRWQAHESFMKALAVYAITTTILLIISYGGWKWVDQPGINLARFVGKKAVRLFLRGKPTLRPEPKLMAIFLVTSTLSFIAIMQGHWNGHIT